MMEALNNNYDTNNFVAEHLQSQVTTIHICGYKNEQNEGDEDGNPPTNHWSVCLQLDRGRSVKLDMAPGYGSDGRRGKIDLASRNHTYTQDAIKSLSFPVKGNARVLTITQLIESNGRDKYTFTEAWEGCRYWVYKFISDLEDAGIVEAGSGQSTWEAVSYYWRNPSGYEARFVGQGVFYT